MILKQMDKLLKFKGFMTLYVETLDNETEEEENSIPELTIGQEVKKDNIEAKTKLY